jgi:hypothetical protein
MAGSTPSLQQVGHQAEATMRHASPWIETLARLGYAAKGVVYIIIGVLAIETIFTGGGKTTDTHGALQAIAQEPFGRLLLGLVTIGLFGFALWRIIQACLDPENKGSDAKGLITRLGYLISGIAYGGVAYGALRLMEGASGSSSTHSTRDWTARLLSEPYGQWLVGILGVIVIGIGIAQFVRSYTANLDKKLDLTGVSAAARTWIINGGRWGVAARGVVFVLIGIFFIEAALHSSSQQAIGLDGALAMLAHQAYGSWLLGLVAAGLIAYGLFALVLARYRRITV